MLGFKLGFTSSMTSTSHIGFPVSTTPPMEIFELKTNESMENAGRVWLKSTSRIDLSSILPRNQYWSINSELCMDVLLVYECEEVLVPWGFLLCYNQTAEERRSSHELIH